MSFLATTTPDYKYVPLPTPWSLRVPVEENVGRDQVEGATGIVHPLVDFRDFRRSTPAVDSGCYCRHEGVSVCPYVCGCPCVTVCVRVAPETRPPQDDVLPDHADGPSSGSCFRVPTPPPQPPCPHPLPTLPTPSLGLSGGRRHRRRKRVEISLS